MNEKTTTSSHQLTPPQRRAVKRIVRFYKDRNQYTGCTSIRIELDDHQYFATLYIKTHRSDCGRYSPRALMCDQYAGFHIGPRGGLKVTTAQSGLNDEIKHVCKMLRAKKF